MVALRWSLLGFVLLVMACTGVRSAMFPEGDRIGLLLTIATAIAVTKCCAVDAVIRGRPMTHGAQWAMVLTWPVAAPVYVVWTRRWGGLLWAFVLAAGVYGAYVAGFLMGSSLGE